MLLATAHAELNIAHNDFARLADACGTRIEGVDGLAWITIDGDRRDVVLSPGDSFVVDSAKPVLVHAIQGPAAVAVHARGG